VPVRAIAFYWRETGDRTLVDRAYPFLGSEEVDDAVHYYQAHRAEIDAELRADLVEKQGSISTASVSEPDPGATTSAR
jgi:hypothetical protein